MARKATAGRPSGKKKQNGAGSGLALKGPKRSARKLDRLSLVRSLITKWSQTLEGDLSKSGVAELIRLLGLERELSATGETVREIKVTWVEPTATESSKSE